mmetsp:Transcript_9037/g.13583  ORF Transcript_9037/g.13583 Transcript_9037/m.13583 type:complete len:319 (-) Transcript_9037:89-1045(-)|eukprot:CAMPEP_0185031712 /NCGR_PEP_ID=MMETSP1103-20130426/19327_1 /TAXON_ID=36769 /ORGANISM="Paraphysomonas bandaiensis, Strain Caron Lab Isolate" /LENGTH=318 /DNA_ID=CAMNT_0027567329 /DNA_START=207 /DNA_END=1163 /DNA_ORIENTATION=+
MRHIHILTLMGLLWYSDVCFSQFTDSEVRMLRKRARDSSLGYDEMRALEEEISASLALRDELHFLRRSGTSEQDRITWISEKLRGGLRQLMEDTKPVGLSTRGTSAAAAAIERAHIREARLREIYEREQAEKEHEAYVSNTRRMELVDQAIRDLRARAAQHQLDTRSLVRLDEMLLGYREAEAAHVFNGTDIHMARARRMQIEKFIGDNQNAAIAHMQRQEALIDQTLRDLAARAGKDICESEQRELDSMLAEYRELSVRVISAQLNQEVRGGSNKDVVEVHRAAQSHRSHIEKYISHLKRESQCSTPHSSRRLSPSS